MSLLIVFNQVPVPDVGEDGRKGLTEHQEEKDGDGWWYRGEW